MKLQLEGDRQKSLISGIMDAEDTQAVAGMLFRISNAFGFSYSTMLVMPARTDKTIGELVLETQLPPEFFDSMDKLSGTDASLLFEMLRKTILPVSWTLDEFRERYRNLGRELPRHFDLFLEYDLTMGLAVPLTAIDGSRHLIRYDGNRKPLTQSEINELTMLTMHVFEAYDQTISDANGGNGVLTAREMEVIHWTAAGKTSVEIGLIMELSEHTINAYLNNAFKKLNCVNRSQLVAKALRMRMIS